MGLIETGTCNRTAISKNSPHRNLGTLLPLISNIHHKSHSGLSSCDSMAILKGCPAVHAALFCVEWIDLGCLESGIGWSGLVWLGGVVASGNIVFWKLFNLFLD